MVRALHGSDDVPDPYDKCVSMECAAGREKDIFSRVKWQRGTNNHVTRKITARIYYVRPRLNARAFPHTPFLMDSIPGVGGSGNSFFEHARARLGASAPPPTRQVSVDYALPKVTGARNGRISFWALLASRWVNFLSQKGVLTKNALPPVESSFRGIRNGHVSFAPPQWGANS